MSGSAGFSLGLMDAERRHRSLFAVELDARDADSGELLAMSDQLLVLLLALELEDQDLVAATLLHHFTGDAGALRVGGKVVAANSQDVGKLDRALAVGRLLDLDHVARGDTVLLAAGADDCVHRSLQIFTARGLKTAKL